MSGISAALMREAQDSTQYFNGCSNIDHSSFFRSPTFFYLILYDLVAIRFIIK